MEDADLFVEAQDAVWADVVAELGAGRKRTHWMWFVFPQLAALGQSPMSQLYGLHDLDEARAYLADDRLRDRLVEAARLVLGHSGRDPVDMLGPVDALKLQSSMTLFSSVPGAPPEFAQVLDMFYGGARCARTAALIGHGTS